MARLKTWRSAAAWALLVLAPPALADSLTARIDAHIAQPRFAAASWGIAVVSLDDGHVVYTHDASRFLLPASTAKLFTAAYALDRLGPAYRTHTDVLAAGNVMRGRLRGPLVLRGRGDPTLAGDAWADTLAAQVKAQGIRRIDGAVVGDDTAFSGAPIGSGWEASDLQAAYGATVGGLTIDENTMTVDTASRDASVTPGDAAVALATTDAPGTQLYREPGTATVHVLRPAPPQGDAAPAIRVRLSLPDPALTAARRLQSALEKQGIRVKGEARSVHWPVVAPKGDVVASLPSPPLVDILRSGLKRSQNLYLQSVFLLLGLEDYDSPALRTENRASEGLASWLAAHGMGPSAVTMEEGTGLSRHDLVTTGALVHVLALMDASPAADTWRGLLPVAGTDGTLARRMRGTDAEKVVLAKTGSMSFVNALAGYVTTKSGQRLAFAILLNNYQPPRHAADPVPAVAADVDAIAVMLAGETQRL